MYFKVLSGVNRLNLVSVLNGIRYYKIEVLVYGRFLEPFSSSIDVFIDTRIKFYVSDLSYRSS